MTQAHDTEARSPEGSGDGLAQLLPDVYEDLRRLAVQYLQRERRGHTLQATALVHEAYLRLVKQRVTRWQNRHHVYRLAALAMRRTLVNYAVQRHSQKRGGRRGREPLDETVCGKVEATEELIAVDEALHKLAAVDALKARIVEMRYFGALTVEMTAAALGTSSATVKREWRAAKLWLLREMVGEPARGGEQRGGGDVAREGRRP